jgi:hypothetical protein
LNKIPLSVWKRDSFLSQILGFDKGMSEPVFGKIIELGLLEWKERTKIIMIEEDHEEKKDV